MTDGNDDDPAIIIIITITTARTATTDAQDTLLDDDDLFLLMCISVMMKCCFFFLTFVCIGCNGDEEKVPTNNFSIRTLSSGSFFLPQLTRRGCNVTYVCATFQNYKNPIDDDLVD
jgi:hypothetical protein